MYQKSFLFKLLRAYDAIVVFLFCKLFFNKRRQVRLDTIQRFGDTEDDTVWQLFWGIQHIEKPEDRAVIFQQIMEETYHAEEFYNTLKQMGQKRLIHSSYERKCLYNDKSDIWKLILYCHIGEAEAEMRFRHFMKFCLKGLEQRAVAKVLADEVGHVTIAYDLLRKMGACDKEIQSEIRNIFWRRRKESFHFLMKRLGGAFLTLLFSMIYYSLGPFVKNTSQKRLRQQISSSTVNFKGVKS